MRYLPLARINDFSRAGDPAGLEQKWHDAILKQINQYRGLARFLDPLDADENAVREVIPWTGFPRIFDAWLSVEEDPDPAERARRMDRAHRSAEILNRITYVKFDGEFVVVPADPMNGLMLYPEKNGAPSIEDAFSFTERPQDEYLEWHVVRNGATRRIERIDFTAEAPEYWETIAKGDPKLLRQLYSDLLKVEVPMEDLFFKSDIFCPEIAQVGEGRFEIIGIVPLFPDDPDFGEGQYNRFNKWNTGLGAVHLTQRNNTLFAEINLAARATQRFAIRPDLSSDVDRFSLTACGEYGAVNRNSDPTIGQAVNSLALSGFRVMVSNPIGLYIGEVDVSGFRDPDGNPVPREAILTIHRGSFDDEDGLARVLRFSIHPPAGADYGLERCTFGGFPLTTGGPIARQTTVVIHGIAMPEEGAHPIQQCKDRVCPHATKKPLYFRTVKAGNSCPRSTDPVWQQEPVTLAPATLLPSLELLARAEAPSHFGRRTL